MTNAMRHRGPDGQGQFTDKGVGLGNRRLSIIDLAGGDQPIGNEDGSIQVVFNGEIYNYVELRHDLIAHGHVFTTSSDTEVIVHAFEQWGTGCLSKFNGMFSFALWDGRTRSVLVARDHLGIKPLYYAEVGGNVIFASEIKALLQHPDCPREVDMESLGELFTYRYVPSPKTLFRGIFKLPPGHYAILNEQHLCPVSYWTSRPVVQDDRSEADLISEYQNLVEDAVRLQLRSDVPVGLFLSSGVDSGALLALMRQYTTAPIQTFTIGFQDGSNTNEIEDAADLARHFGAEHHSMVLGPDDYIRYYDRYMLDLEEPVGNETAASFYFVAKMASQHVKVVLTGQGADEPWAGYDRYIGVQISQWYSRLPGFLTQALGNVSAHIPGRFERLKRGTSSLGERDMLTRLAKIYSFFSPDMKANLYTGVLKDSLVRDPFAARKALGRLQSEVRSLSPLAQMLYIDTRASLPDDLLMVSDKTSMACSIESRVPFLDHRLVEFVENLPLHFKLRGLTGKYLHKRACLKWLPERIVYRKKKGFSNPIQDWFRVRMRSFVEDALLSSKSVMRQYFDQSYIRKMLELDRAGIQQYRRHIYLLVSLELWHAALFSR